MVIVESPAKARTIQGYLGPGYDVEASVGHVRDLPDGAAEVPAKYKGLPWAKLAVDVEHDFTPIYVVHPSKRSRVAELRATPAPTTKTRAGGTLPAAVTWPVKSRPNSWAASMTAR